MNRRIAATFVAGALFGSVVTVQVVPHYGAPVAQGDNPSALGATGNDGSNPDLPAAQVVPGGEASRADRAADGGAPSQGLPIPPAKPGLTCAPGSNGGSTDQGVTATEIKLATTVAESGIGAAFLGQMRFGIEAVRNEVNRQGGICGRKLTIQYIDDAWDAQKGSQFIRNFLPNVFAIPVAPSSEGLRAEITNGDIDRARVPVVGTDGLVIDQYTCPSQQKQTCSTGSAQPWVWPIASATVASARVMAQNAHKTGAKTFGIVFDKNYRFGQEAAEAFSSEVLRLTGKRPDGYNPDNNCQRRYCGIQAGQSSYSNEVIEYYKTRVDFTALFLEPQTALVWMADPNTPSGRSVRYGGAQPLFTRDFALNCQEKCDQMTVWTGFKPYIETYKQDPAVRGFVADLQRTNPQADIYNQFTEGAYLGMRVLVAALKIVGPDLTRARLKATMDRLTHKPGLAFVPEFAWRPDLRYVNTKLQGFTVQYRGTFSGWRSDVIEKDPHPNYGTR